MQTLTKNAYLGKLFDKLVVSQNILSEDEFWKYEHHALFSSKKALTDFQYLQKFNLQKPGFQSAPMFFRSVHNITTGEEDLEISESQIEQLLRDYPKLSLTYEGMVPSHKTEQEYWKEFLKKNKQYHTLLFGGNNPLFILDYDPQKEADYEDNFQNDNFRLEAYKREIRDKLEEDTKGVRVFQQLDQRPCHGSYSKKFETDEFMS